MMINEPIGIMEFRAIKEGSGKDNNWHPVYTKYTTIFTDADFNFLHVRKNGKVFTSCTEEFKKIFQQEVFWQNLSVCEVK